MLHLSNIGVMCNSQSLYWCFGWHAELEHKLQHYVIQINFVLQSRLELNTLWRWYYNLQQMSKWQTSDQVFAESDQMEE